MNTKHAPGLTPEQIAAFIAKDYHELSMAEKADLVAIAKAEGYRKPKGAAGSYGRAYHARMRRVSDAMGKTGQPSSVTTNRSRA